MSSVLFIEPVYFGSHPGINDNTFAGSARVSAQQADNDHVMAVTTISEECAKLRELGFSSTLLKMKNDPHGAAIYEDRGDAIFPNNSISFHNFTDDDGNIVRRVVILYPMSTHRRGELPQAQLLKKLQKAALQRTIELVDLRAFEQENRCLEGTGALNFSADGKFVYMSRSQRTDDELLEIVCDVENLNIPPENRFVFASAMPSPAGEVQKNVVYHTNILGWCGRDICAWGLGLMQFDSQEQSDAFYDHLEKDFKLVLELSDDEVRGFAGNSIELATVYEDGTEVRVLCMSNTAMRSLQENNLDALRQWYGEENLLIFYGEVLERRTGGSVRCTCAASILHGSALPAPNEPTILDLCDIEEK